MIVTVEVRWAETCIIALGGLITVECEIWTSYFDITLL
jgi:hypothetical protein